MYAKCHCFASCEQGRSQGNEPGYPAWADFEVRCLAEHDAVAVVVSEETGVISLAINGEIERSLTPDQLRLRLGAALDGRQPMLNILHARPPVPQQLSPAEDGIQWRAELVGDRRNERSAALARG